MGLLAGLRLTMRGAMLLFALFLGQFLAPAMPEALWRLLPGHLSGAEVHYFFTFLYLAAFAVLLPRAGRHLLALVRPTTCRTS